jgi:integrase
MVILNALFSWLVGAGYLAGNPLSLSRQRARRAAPRVTRFLELDLWQEVKLYINSLPRDTDRERARYWRARWLFTLLYLGGLRISEVSGNTMGDFFCRRDAGGHERWWLEITGKGDKARLVPASTEMMIELGHYRSECGLPVLPAGHEDTPLVLPLGQSTMPLTRAALHTIVKGIFAGAAEKLRMRGEEYAARAAQLERASAHWLRHSAGSHMADCDVDLRMIRDNLGHVSLRRACTCMPTTMIGIRKPNRSIVWAGNPHSGATMLDRQGNFIELLHRPVESITHCSRSGFVDQCQADLLRHSPHRLPHDTLLPHSE